MALPGRPAGLCCNLPPILVDEDVTSVAGKLGGLALMPSLSAADVARRRLTPSEYEVLRLMSSGLANRQIAQRLGISPGSVERHMRALYTKLGARTRAEAATIAHEAGLLGQPQDKP